MYIFIYISDFVRKNAAVADRTWVPIEQPSESEIATKRVVLEFRLVLIFNFMYLS